MLDDLHDRTELIKHDRTELIEPWIGFFGGRLWLLPL